MLVRVCVCVCAYTPVCKRVIACVCVRVRTHSFLHINLIARAHAILVAFCLTDQEVVASCISHVTFGDSRFVHVRVGM